MKLVPDTIETARLRLRPFSADDLAAHAAINADPEVMRYVGRGKPQSEHDSWHGLAWMLGHWQLRGVGFWAVCRRDDGRLIGRAGFIDSPDWPGLELAWILERASWGQGLAFEACSAIRAACADYLRGRELISLIYPDNAPSIRLAGRLGAVADGEVPLMGATLLRFRHR